MHTTEALIAVDVNSGRSTRERHIDETAIKTNLEAADEVSRQLRLRDLAGLVVIDFIDMSENRHQKMVERRLREALKLDRARIQLGRISMFGLMELSRQRLRPSLQELSSQSCPTCHGLGVVRSTESCALQALRLIQEAGIKGAAAMQVTLPADVGLYLLNQKRDALHRLEARYAMGVVVAVDTRMMPAEIDVQVGAKREVEPDAAALAPPASTPAVTAPDEEEQPAEAPRRRERPTPDALTVEAAADEDEDAGGKKRRRRRRRRRRDEPGEAPREAAESDAGGADADETEADETVTAAPPAPTGDAEAEAERPRRRRKRRGGPVAGTGSPPRTRATMHPRHPGSGAARRRSPRTGARPRRRSSRPRCRRTCGRRTPSPHLLTTPTRPRSRSRRLGSTRSATRSGHPTHRPWPTRR